MNYNCSLKYIKGNTNVVADALSRVEVQLDPAMVLATLAGAVVGPYECTEVDNIDDSDTQSGGIKEKVILVKVANSTDCKWAEIQCTDTVIAAVIHWLEGGKKGCHGSPPRSGLQKSEEGGQQVPPGEQTVIPQCRG